MGIVIKLKEAIKRVFRKDESSAQEMLASQEYDRFIKSLWHPITERPENRALLVQFKDGRFMVTLYSMEVKEFGENWMYLEDIIPSEVCHRIYNERRAFMGEYCPIRLMWRDFTSKNTPNYMQWLNQQHRRKRDDRQKEVWI